MDHKKKGLLGQPMTNCAVQHPGVYIVYMSAGCSPPRLIENKSNDNQPKRFAYPHNNTSTKQTQNKHNDQAPFLYAILILFLVFVIFLFIFDLRSFPIFYDQSPATCCLPKKENSNFLSLFFIFLLFWFFLFLFWRGMSTSGKIINSRDSAKCCSFSTFTKGNHVSKRMVNFPYIFRW